VVAKNVAGSILEIALFAKFMNITGVKVLNMPCCSRAIALFCKYRCESWLRVEKMATGRVVRLLSLRSSV